MGWRPTRYGFPRVSYGFLSLWQGKMERCPFLDFSFRPNTAVMPVDHALDQRQANPGAFKLFLRMEALENPKQFPRIFHVKPNPVVLHIIVVLGSFRAGPNFDCG